MSRRIYVPQKARLKITVNTTVDTEGMKVRLNIDNAETQETEFYDETDGVKPGEDLIFFAYGPSLNPGIKYIVEIYADPGGRDVGLYPINPHHDELVVLDLVAV